MKHEKKDLCTVCKIPYFERNNYYFGKLMTVRDFFDEQCYFNEKRWLINRMILGWGVVCGLDVVPNTGNLKQVIVKPGMAIDCCGREILVCGEETVDLVPQESECHKLKAQQKTGNKTLLVCLEFFDCKTEHVHLPPVTCEKKEKVEFARIRDSFIIRPIELERETPKRTSFCPRTDDEKEKSLHDYICDRLRDFGECPKCPARPCVILAEVTVDSEGNIVHPIDQCSRRKFVYNNPLLYDLIDCFHADLPHVSKISWHQHHAKKIEWDIFANDIIATGCQVRFNKRMIEDTINRHTFLVSVVIVDAATGYRLVRRIPPENGVIQHSIDNGGGHQQTVSTFKFESNWLKDEVNKQHSALATGFQLEILLRGSSIFSVDEKALDGCFHGTLPSGKGTQGSDFLSWFSVRKRPGDSEEQSNL